MFFVHYFLDFVYLRPCVKMRKQKILVLTQKIFTIIYILDLKSN